jgi:hypothetical protein
MNKKISLLLVFAIAALFENPALAIGIGSQSWGDQYDDYGGSGTLGDALLIIFVTLACWWLAISEKSPLANAGFGWQMLMFLFGPAIVINFILPLFK